VLELGREREACETIREASERASEVEAELRYLLATGDIQRREGEGRGWEQDDNATDVSSISSQLTNAMYGFYREISLRSELVSLRSNISCVASSWNSRVASR
jgi:hypothetical protein